MRDLLVVPVIINRVLSALNAHDLYALASCYHDDYESVQPHQPTLNFRGKDKLIHSWSTLFTIVPNLTAELRNCTCVDDKVQTVWHWCGTSTDGMPYESNGVITYTLREGKIARACIVAEPVITIGPDWENIIGSLLNPSGPTDRHLH
jgi:ketosteroid isomerase-like protein